MSNRFRSLPFLTLLVAISITACGPTRSSNDNLEKAAIANASNGNSADDSTSPNENVEDLRAVINVPFEPSEVSWRIVPDKEDGDRLIAVLRLPTDEADPIVSNIRGDKKTISSTVGVEEWFPPELIAMGEIAGGSTISAEAIPATQFVRPPFSSGNVYVIPESEYLVVEIKKTKE